MVKRRKRRDRLAAFALAVVVAATSCMPAISQPVYAAEGDESSETESPFGKNVAKGKEVTIEYPEGANQTDANKDRIVDGFIAGTAEEPDVWWESNKLISGTDQENKEIPLEDQTLKIVIDLGKSYLIDRIDLIWRVEAAPDKYVLETSENGQEWTAVVADAKAPTEIADRQEKHIFTPKSAQYVRLTCKETRAYNVYTLREIEVYTVGSVEEPGEIKYALNKPAGASKDNNNSIGWINDGNTNTRWETGGMTQGDSGYCYIDLGGVYTINQVKLLWEGAYASSYTIETATDEAAITEDNLSNADMWKQADSGTIESSASFPLEKVHDFAEVQARYVKLTGTTGTGYGLSIWEMEINRVRNAFPVETVYISETSKALEKGKTLQLYHQILPANADNQEVTWSSSNEEAATVDQNGLVTAVGTGSTDITVTTSDGNKTAVCAVTVVGKVLGTPNVSAVLEDGKIKLSWAPVEDATSYKIFRSEGNVETEIADPQIVSGETELTYTDDTVEEGKSYAYQVQAVSNDDSIVDSEKSEKTSSITIPKSVTSVTITNQEPEVVVGGTLKLDATVEPSDATDKTLKWSSENTEVATVNETTGEVTAIAAGTAKITAAAANGVAGECTVTVKARLATPRVSANKSGDGYDITVSWDKVDNAVSYDIYRESALNGAFATPIKTGLTDLTYVDESLADGTYCYKVVAKSDGTNYYDSLISEATAVVQVGEISPFGVNVALNKTVTVEYPAGMGDYVDTRKNQLVDGFVAPNEGEGDAWWETPQLISGTDENNAPIPLEDQTVTITIDLEKPYFIDCVNIVWRVQASPNKFDLEVSKDGQDWNKVVTDSNTPPDSAEGMAQRNVKYPFEAQDVQYVRLTCKEVRAYNVYTIREIEAYTVGTVEAENPPEQAESIYISRESATLDIDEKLRLYAQMLPMNTTDTITWTSADTEVATVDENGVVTAKKVGTTRITAASTKNEDVKVTCEITVAHKLPAPQVSAAVTDDNQIKLTWEAVSGASGYEIYRIKNGTEEKINDPKITGTDTLAYTDASVEGGNTYSYYVIAVAEADSDNVDSNPSASTEPIELKNIITKIAFANAAEVLGTGETLKLEPVITPENPDNKSLTWKSSNEDVATVDENGVVTAHANGDTVITASAVEGNATAECAITVRARLGLPTVINAAKTDDYQVTLFWSPVENAGTYDIYRATSLRGEFTLYQKDVTGTEYIDKDLSDGIYIYKIVVKPANEDTRYIQSVMSPATASVLVGEISPFGTNVALGKKVTVEYPQGVTPVENNWNVMVDGQVDNAVWEATSLAGGNASGPEPYPVKVLIDLGDSYLIDSVDITWRWEAAAKEYTVEVSEDNVTWNEVAESTDPPTSLANRLKKHAFEPQDVRYVRINCNTTTQYNTYTIREIEVNTIGTVNSTDEDLTVKNIYISQEEAVRDINKKLHLYAQVLPANASNGTITWASTDEAIATVDGNGIVTTKGYGEVDITATAGGKTATCHLSVAIQLDTPEVTAERTGDEEITLTWKAIENAAGYKVYRSSGGAYTEIETPDIKVEAENVTYVDSAAVRGATYTYRVVAVSSGGEHSASSDMSEPTEGILIPLAATEITFINTETEIAVGATLELKPQFNPSNADTSLTWDSKNKSVATVDDKGVVTAVGAGEAVITATAVEGGKTAEYTITVKAKLATPTVKAVKSDDYQITVSWNTVANAATYDVYRASSANGTFALIGEDVEATEYVDKEGEELPDGTYCYKVVAKPADATYLASEKSAVTQVIQIGQISPFGANVALGATVSVNYPDGVTPTDEEKNNWGVMVDGTIGGADAGEWWESAKKPDGDAYSKEEYPVDVVLDLKESYLVDHIDLTWRDLAAADTYAIWVSETGLEDSWTKVASEEGANITFDTRKRTFTFEPQNVQYIKVECIKTSAFSSYTIREIEVYTIGTVEEPGEGGELAVNKIYMSQDTAELELDKKLRLYAQVMPANAANADITWDSDNKDVATVDPEGRVTAVGLGSANITATAGGITEKCVVTVTKQIDTPVVSAVLADSKDKITVSWQTLTGAEAYTLYRSTDNVKYEEITDAEYTIADGTVTYEDTNLEGGKNYYYKVQAENKTNPSYLASEMSAATEKILVPILLKGITLQTEATVEIGKSVVLPVTYDPADASDKTGTWTTSNGDVATVKDGTVTGVSQGTATIKFVTTDGGFEKTCAVTVVKKLETPVVTAEKTGENAILVSWAAIEGASGYAIYRSVDGGAGEEISGAEFATEDGTVSYMDTDVEQGKTYSYTVEAKPAQYYLASDKSAATTAVRIPVLADEFTLDMDACEMKPGEEITLTSTIKPDNADEVEITWTSSNEEVAVVEDGVVSALAIGKTTITASIDNGRKTAECEITVKDTLKAPVVTAKAGTAQATLTWQAVENAAEYEIYRATAANGTYTKIAEHVKGVTYTNTGLAAGTYFYKVIAKAAADSFYNDSEMSAATAAVTVAAAVTAPTQVTGLKVSKAATKSLTLTWTAISGATYRVVVYKGKTKVKEVTANSNTVTISGLAVATDYEIQVTAYRGTFFGPTTTLKTATAPAKAKLSSAKKKAAKAALVKWKKVKNATGYEVYMKQGKKGKYKRVKLIKKAKTVSFKKTKLKAGKTYYFKVRAYRKTASGNVYGAFSSQKKVKM